MVEDNIFITPFQHLSSTQRRYTFRSTCEHTLLENCSENPSDFRITLDFSSSDLEIRRVGVRLRNIEVIVSENFSLRIRNLSSDTADESSVNDIITHSNSTVAIIGIQSLGVMLTRSKGQLSLTVTREGLLQQTCGLCGSLMGSLLFSDRSTEAIIGDRNSIAQFVKSWRVNPGEELVQELRKECGKPIRSNKH